MRISGFRSTNNSFGIEDTPFVLGNCINSIHDGVDVIYTYIENVYFYDFQFMYLWGFPTLFDYSFYYYFFFFWFVNGTVSNFSLVYSVLLDYFINSTIIKTSFNDDWFRNIVTSPEMSCFILDHPEMIWIQSSRLDFFAESSYYLTLCEKIDTESWYLPVMLAPQLILLVYLTYLLLLMYLSFFSSNTKEENSNDNDFFLSTVSVEAEKEIGSFDDIILVLVALFYIFGWFFYIYVWSLLNQAPELTFVFYLFPLFYYLIILTPTYLAFDFGIFFLAYLGGAGKTSLLLGEVFSDTVAFAVFYIRKLIHAVRLGIVAAVIFELQEFVMLYSFDQYFLIGNESIADHFNKELFSLRGSSYFIFMTLPTYLFHWIFEVLHTLVYVTVQSFAFFAMVFWLYFYFYTFFVFEKYENYFKTKREEKISQLKKLYFFKKLSNLK